LVAEADFQARVKITPANWRDWGGVMTLEKLCFGRDAWSALDVAAALTLPDTVRLKAVLDEKMIGLVVGDIRRRDQVGWIATIAVHPSHRRRGLGRRLLHSCERAMAMPRVKLTLRVSNKVAHNLYLQEGYEQVQFWRGYYANGEDALVMEKIIL
jgi:ribosomal protein S18 acetylase RimI-like enzyme